MSLIPTYPAGLYYEAAFNAAPSAVSPPLLYVDITSRTVFSWSTTRGRQYELDTVPAGQWTVSLDNRDGALDPSNVTSPYYPNVLPYRGCRIRALTGVNLLTADQATAGEATGYLGAVANLPALNVANDYGYAVSVVTSGSAYQGAQVYQAVLPSGATQFATVMLVEQIHVQPSTYYSFQAQVQVTAGNSPVTSAAILWYDNAGNELTAIGGASATITAGSGTWTELTVSGQSPSGAYSAWLKIELASGTLTAATTFQVDALQFEASMTPTSWQMPQTVSQNLLPRQIATGTQSINPVTDSAANWFYPTAGTVAQATWLPAPPPGQTTALAWTTPSGTTNASPLYAGVASTGASATGPVQDITQVTASLPYTASVYLSRTSSADATVQVVASFRWFDVNGDLLSTSSGTAVTVPTGGSWARATCTATAPAGAVWARMRIYISSPASTTASNTIYTAAWQLEQASSASTWADPGPTQYIYTGSFERFPQTWTMGGTFGQVQAIGVDPEALLAQDTLFAPFVEEVLALGPDMFYQLADPAGSGSCVDSSANRLPAPIENAPSGPGSVTLGSSITSTTPPGTFVGTAGPVAAFANTVSGPGVQKAETYINIAKTTVTPGPPTSGSWTRMIAFSSTNVPAAGTEMNLWTAYPASWNASNLSSWWFQLFAGGFASINVANATNNGLSYAGTTNLCDGNWHQMICTVDAVNGQIRFYIDGALVDSVAGTSYPTGIVADAVGCSITTGTNAYCQGYVGDIAHLVEFPFALSTTQVTNLYQSWRNASAGESSGARAERVLTWLGYNDPVAIDAGATSNMGPATDLTGATGLDALNAIALTENGNLYVAANGTLTLKSRYSRYNQTAPLMVFGENYAWGEWPYESITADFDPTHLFNDIQVTQYSTSQVAESIDATSEGLYYQRILQRTTNQGLYTESVDCANYLLQQYKTARMRISDLTLHPTAVPGLFAACMQLELGSRIRVMRRPPTAPAIEVDCFVESIAWNLDPDTGDITVHLQCSPADLSRYWSLGAAYTTLNALAASGQNQAVINALPDSAYNPLNASLPQGYQLTFDVGTQFAETLTIAPPLPATAPGWSKATLTFTTNFLYTHQANSIVTEPLPTGYSDPTTWNTGTVLPPLYSTVVSATSGTVTVNPLADYRTNPGQADWAVGDSIWVSPGTARFQGYNLLHPNIATAGGGVLPLAAGTLGSTIGVTGDNGAPTVTSSGSAYQGSTVWQAAVAAHATSGSGLLYVLKTNATAGVPFTVSAYVASATSGANPSVYTYIKFLSATGASLGQTNGTTTGLTGSATPTWTRLTATGTAPAGTVWVQLGIVLTGTSPASAWNFQADGLQIEQAASASAFQTCPQVSAVSAAVAGYSPLTLTLANFTGAGTAAGDWVCDPLPPGTTSPTAVAGTTRIAY